MAQKKGHVVSVNGNMVNVRFEGDIVKNEVAYIKVGDTRLKSEVIRISDGVASMQVYEMTTGVGVGDEVEFSGELLSVELGPGLLSQVYDGLQNPLPELADKCGNFLQRGVYLDAIPDRDWPFTALAKAGDIVVAGDTLGTVPEGSFTHHIMVPFGLQGQWKVESIVPDGTYNVRSEIAVISDGRQKKSLSMVFDWPVKKAIGCYEERLMPDEPMVTKIRIIDTFLPVAKGGTYCTPGPFGAGKTVLQHLTSRNADVDIVIIAACGERAGEVVEVLKEFPELVDPRTGRSLMERTIIICNTSSMPVAAREASVYTAATLAEYYRNMGLDVLLLADSTSRWAQAMREMSGRLEEIPGEEAFPAYLESRIAEFYERAGKVRLKDGTIASVTIGGTVSPAGGNFEEPVTQATLKVVGAFHGLSRERSDARKYPAIDPLDSWSKYTGGVWDSCTRQRGQPDDEGRGRGGHQPRGLHRLSEGRTAGCRIPPAELVRSGRLRRRPGTPEGEFRHPVRHSHERLRHRLQERCQSLLQPAAPGVPRLERHRAGRREVRTVQGGPGEYVHAEGEGIGHAEGIYED